MGDLYLTLSNQVRMNVFEKNVLQGGYLEVNRGSANRTGWNSIIGSFMISKAPNSVKKMGKNYGM